MMKYYQSIAQESSQRRSFLCMKDCWPQEKIHKAVSGRAAAGNMSDAYITRMGTNMANLSLIGEGSSVGIMNMSCNLVKTIP